MERIEPGIREEEKSIGRRAGQYATGWSHLAHLFYGTEEKRLQTSTSEAAGAVNGWTGEAARVGAFTSNLAFSAPDYPT